MLKTLLVAATIVSPSAEKALDELVFVHRSMPLAVQAAFHHDICTDPFNWSKDPTWGKRLSLNNKKFYAGLAYGLGRVYEATEGTDGEVENATVLFCARTK
jgi:hypothetical protein